MWSNSKVAVVNFFSIRKGRFESGLYRITCSFEKLRWMWYIWITSRWCLSTIFWTLFTLPIACLKNAIEIRILNLALSTLNGRSNQIKIMCVDGQVGNWKNSNFKSGFISTYFLTIQRHCINHGPVWSWNQEKGTHGVETAMLGDSKMNTTKAGEQQPDNLIWGSCWKWLFAHTFFQRTLWNPLMIAKPRPAVNPYQCWEVNWYFRVRLYHWIIEFRSHIHSCSEGSSAARDTTRFRFLPSSVLQDGIIQIMSPGSNIYLEPNRPLIPYSHESI